MSHLLLEYDASVFEGRMIQQKKFHIWLPYEIAEGKLNCSILIVLNGKINKIQRVSSTQVRNV